jgi:hypothetical protein
MICTNTGCSAAKHSGETPKVSRDRPSTPLSLRRALVRSAGRIHRRAGRAPLRPVVAVLGAVGEGDVQRHSSYRRSKALPGVGIAFVAGKGRCRGCAAEAPQPKAYLGNRPCMDRSSMGGRCAQRPSWALQRCRPLSEVLETRLAEQIPLPPLTPKRKFEFRTPLAVGTLAVSGTTGRRMGGKCGTLPG